MSESARKEFKELQALIRRRGYKTAPSKSGHVLILDKNGRRVIDDHGPVILSTTPGDFRARDLAVQRLVRAGVLAEDPNKPTPKKERGLMLGGDRSAEAEKLRKNEEQRETARTRHERTQTIRSRLEPFITSLGGWTKRGMQTEMGDVLHHFTQEMPSGFGAKSTAYANVVSLRKGGTLSDKAADCWEALLDDLEQAPIPRTRWFDLVRAARGLPSRSEKVSIYSAQTIVDPKPQKVIYEGNEGKLAAELALMYDKSPLEGEPHPVLEMHRNGGIRWFVDFTIDDLNDLNRSLGFFEGLSTIEPTACEAALARLRTMIEKVGEARFRQMTEREKETA